MTFFRYEIVDPADFDADEQVFDTTCHFLRLRHIGGAEDVHVSLVAGGVVASVIVSPPGGIYPQEIQMESAEGWDRVRPVAQGGPPDGELEVTAWR